MVKKEGQIHKRKRIRKIKKREERKKRKNDERIKKLIKEGKVIIKIRGRTNKEERKGM